jgi:hypothetical protein
MIYVGFDDEPTCWMWVITVTVMLVVKIMMTVVVMVSEDIVVVG